MNVSNKGSSPAETFSQTQDASVPMGRLSTIDRWLPAWIAVAMAAGLLLGRLVPGISQWLAGMEVGGISLPIALGLLVMMYPVLAKVRYDKIAAVTGDRRSWYLHWFSTG